MNPLNRNRRALMVLGVALTTVLSLGFFLKIVAGNSNLAEPVILAVYPINAAHNAPITGSVVVTFDQPINPATVNTGTFPVHDMQSGLLTQTYQVVGDQIILNPAAPFWPGTLVEASVTTGTMNLLGENLLEPKVWRFRTAVSCGSGTFTDTLQSFGSAESWDVAVGDLDGDNDLDVFVVTADFQPNKVWFNDGNGNFTPSVQDIGADDSTGVDLGDVDGDGDLDAYVSNWRSQPNRLYFNDGNGFFTESGQNFGTIDGTGIDLGDLDGDGDLDAVTTHGTFRPDKVWHNDGQGNFTFIQNLGDTAGRRVALGDLDMDGDLDAFITSRYENVVWFNDGDGTFTDSGQMLGNYRSAGIGLGDLDGDGDLDAFISNLTDSPPRDPANRVWINDGSGFFTDTNQLLGNEPSFRVSIGDLDADGDLDAYVANAQNIPNKIWVNDGAGNFTDSGFAQGAASSQAIGLGDFDGNGTLDAWIANDLGAGDELWLNIHIPADDLMAANDSPTLLGDTTTLTATATAGPTAQYHWDFGDGQQGQGQIVPHIYPAPGVYTATVTIVECGTMVEATTIVTIIEPKTPTPTATSTATSTPTPTSTPTATPTATPTMTPSPVINNVYIPVVYQKHPIE